VVRTSVGVAHAPLPGAAYRYGIDLGVTSVLVKAGHRVRLDVSSSEYPTYEPNPNTGGRITTDVETEPATQHLFHDVLHPSRLILPIIPR
jgi:putative CocE/NonD family hydrolase